MKLKVLLLTILTLVYFSAIAQKQSNIWYFGKYGGLDFNSGSAVVLNNGAMNNFEGVSSISDRYGSLLFYTDGLTVFNKNHEIMQNGSNLAGHPSSTQSGIIIPVPNSDTKYIIFTVDYAYSIGALSYSMVDITLDNGLGGITVKNVLLQSNCAEKISAVIHANLTDIWVVVHERSSNIFKSYKVTASGVSGTVVTSAVGTSIGDGVQGYLKCSSDGQYLAMATYHTRRVDIFNFNQITGAITFNAQYSFPDATYGVEFSKDSRFVYASVSYDMKQIYQIDVENNNMMLIATTNMAPGALQMGPDGKIYVAKYNRPNTESKYLGIIHNPDGYGTSCNYEDQALHLGSGASLMGLPSFIQSYFNSAMAISAFNSCIGESTQLTVSLSDDILNNLDWINWDFGDPESSDNTSTLLSPFHVFSDTGAFVINVSISVNGDIIQKEQEIRVYDNPKINLPDTIYLCDNTSTIIVAGDQNYSYEWSNQQITPTIEVSTTGTLWVRKISLSGCIASDTVEIKSASSPLIELPDIISICPDSSAIVTAGDNNHNYLWSTDDTTSQIQLNNAGSFWVRKTAITGCHSTHNFTVNEYLIPDLDLGADTMLCGESITFSINGFMDYRWSDGTALNTLTVFEPGAVSVMARTFDNCPVNDEVEVFECCDFALIFPNAFTPNNDGINETFKPIISGISQYKMTIANRWGVVLFTTNDPEIAWDGKYQNELCAMGVYFVLFEYERCSLKRGFYNDSTIGCVTIIF